MRKIRGLNVATWVVLFGTRSAGEGGIWATVMGLSSLLLLKAFDLWTLLGGIILGWFLMNLGISYIHARLGFSSLRSAMELLGGRLVT